MDFGLCKGKPIPQNSLISGSGNPLGFLATFGQACDHLGGNHKFPSKKCQEDLDVSENSGTPKSSILIGFSIINHPFRGTPILGNTQISEAELYPPHRWSFFSLRGRLSGSSLRGPPPTLCHQLQTKPPENFFFRQRLFFLVILSASRFPSCFFLGLKNHSTVVIWRSFSNLKLQVKRKPKKPTLNDLS